MKMSYRGLKTLLVLGILVGSFFVMVPNVTACFSVEVEVDDDVKYADRDEYAMYEISISLSPGCRSTYWVSFTMDGLASGWEASILNTSGGQISFYPTEYVYSGTVTVVYTVKHTVYDQALNNEFNTLSVFVRINDYYNQDDTIQVDLTTRVNNNDLAPDPVDLSENGKTTNQVNLTWSESTELPWAFDRYEVHMSSVPEFTPVGGTLIAEIYFMADREYEVLGLSPGTTYYFAVRVWDNGLDISGNPIQAGPQFADSNILEVATPGINYPPIAVWLEDPSDVTNREASLNWSLNIEEDFAQYEIHVSNVSGFVLGPETLFVDPITNQSIIQYRVQGLAEADTLYFRIRVRDNGNMINDSNEVTCDTLDYIPPASILYEPWGTGANETNLYWSQNHDTDFDRYEVHMSQTPGFTPTSQTEIDTFTQTVDNETVVKGLTSETTYYFIVRTYDKTGNFADSNEVSVTTPDVTKPKIILTAPVNEAIDIMPDTNVVVTFSEEIDTSTLLYTCSPDPGGWSVSWNTQGDEATFTHSNDFDDDSTITFTITQAKDMASNDLASDVIPNPFSFETKDLTPPEITGNSPVDDAVDILCNCDITITFSEEMDESSVENAIQVTFDHDTSWNGNTLTITPDADLDYSTEYTVSVKTTAKDAQGNNLATKYTFSFTTEEADVNHPPEVVVTSTFDDEADETYTIEWTATDSDGDTISINIYYDTDNDDSYGLKLIKSGYSNTGSYEWDTSDISDGEYFIYIRANDGENQAGAYVGKLTIAHAEDPGDGDPNPSGTTGEEDEMDFFPLILLIIVIVAILVAALVGVMVLGKKKSTGMGETITCPSCGGQFTANTAVSPYVTCPHCGTSGMMR
jgi:flagellar basal body-associated protein FliL